MSQSFRNQVVAAHSHTFEETPPLCAPQSEVLIVIIMQETER